MNDDFLRDLERKLAAVRKRKNLLQVIALGLGCVAIFALLWARAAFDQGGSVAYLQWPSLLVAGIAVALMVAVYVAIERDA